MFVFVVLGNSQSAFLGLERRRDCARRPNRAFFGEVFAIFGPFFAKSGSFFAKMESKRGVFEDFEKGGGVFALSGRIGPSRWVGTGSGTKKGIIFTGLTGSTG